MSKNEKEVVVSKHIQEAAETLAKHLNTSDDGAFSFKEGALEAILPEGLTVETIKEVNKFRDTAIAASLEAIRQPAIDLFSRSPKVEQITASLNFDSDKISHGIDRVRHVSAPGKTEKTAVPGYTVTKYQASGGSNKRGELKKVHARMKAAALAVALG